MLDQTKKSKKSNQKSTDKSTDKLNNESNETSTNQPINTLNQKSNETSTNQPIDTLNQESNKTLDNQNSIDLSENKSSKLLKFLKNHYIKISIVSYLSAFLVFSLLISEQLCDKTYFSDNALLPGFVNRNFNFNQQTLNNLNELEKLNLGTSNELSKSRMPIEWLMNKFKNLGLQGFTQEFKLEYPFGKKRNVTGRNVYAILRSTRSLNTEALVLSSPFRIGKSNTLPGISLLISLAEYFSIQNYWSKDLIFLIYEHELIGCEAWLNSYFNLNDNQNLIKSEELIERSGIIQAALNIDFTTQSASNLDIRIEGLNGQLPNLDLFNVVVEIASRESRYDIFDATFHQYSHIFSPDQFEIWQEYAKTIGSMILTQASTFTNGAHGLFQKRSIQSLTLVAEEDKEDNDYLKSDLNQLGKIIEGTIRSCNNMIERFNRSYWFYLLPSTRRYLSISFYMIPIALFVLPSLLKAFIIYIKLLDEYRSVIEEFWFILPQLFWVYFYGLVIASFPFIIQNSSKLQLHFNFKTEDLLFYSLLAFMNSLIFSPIINDDLQLKNDRKKFKIISIQKYVALLNLALIITCLSLVNISLALILSAIYIPIMCTITGPPQQSKITNLYKLRIYLHKLMLILINPLSLVYFGCLLKSFLNDELDQSLLMHLNNSFLDAKRIVLLFVEEWYLFGNWTYLLGSVFIFPLWLQWYKICDL